MAMLQCVMRKGFSIRSISSSLLNLEIRVGVNSHKPIISRLFAIKANADDEPYYSVPSQSSYAHYRYLYPEFLPNPDMARRHQHREQLERKDMLNRRSVIYIPEFYAGSIMAVIASDLNAPGKKSRFVGICIQRAEHGLRAFFTLRNIIEGQGIEITYDLYNPTILSIEVLKLEKRLDDTLLYLKDALPEYSTIPFDMEAIPHLEGTPVPINPIKVKLKPRPWHARWERMKMKGIESVEDMVTEKMRKQAKQHETPWVKFDMMKEYRNTIPEDDQEKIFSQLDEYHQTVASQSSKVRRKRLVSKPKKTA